LAWFVAENKARRAVQAEGKNPGVGDSTDRRSKHYTDRLIAELEGLLAWVVVENKARRAAKGEGKNPGVGDSTDRRSEHSTDRLIAELEGLLAWFAAENKARRAVQGEGKKPGGDDLRSGDYTDRLVASIKVHLDGARATAAHKDEPGGRWIGHAWTHYRRHTGGSPFERALGNIDAAEADVLRIAPSHYLVGLLPSVVAHVNRFLPKDDPRRERLRSVSDDVADANPSYALSDSDRTAVVVAFHAANSQRRRELLRVRSFRNVVIVASVVMLMVAVGLGVLGSLKPELMPLCFVPDDEKVVCPTGEQALPAHVVTGAQSGETVDPRLDDVDDTIAAVVSVWDYWLVEIVGLVAAAVAGAFSLRALRGTATPYSLPVAIGVLKLPTGALTAVLGLLLMRGGFVPGLSALDTSAQILAWAVVFGYSQQLFTRFVDQQASAVLEDVKGRGAAGDKRTEARPAV
jgi:hypothetical protein